MAAIGPNVGEQAAVPKDERAPVVCRKDVAADLKGLGHSDQTATVLACAPPLEVSHAGLTRFVWVRRLFEEALTERSYHIEKKGKEYHFVLSSAIPKDLIPWHAQGSHVARMNLLSENGKMATKSWDLPAGALEVGGACPGAKTGQSIVPPAKREGAKAQLKIIQDISGRPHDMTAAICEMCVTGDSLILVKGEGLVPIASLVDRGDVEVWSGKGWRTTHAVLNGVREVVELQTSWGATLRLTPDHKVMTLDRGMVEAQELTVDDRLVYELPDASPFPANAPLHLREQGPRYRTENESNFPTEWSRDVGVLLGYILGDGAIYYGKYPTVSLVAGVADRGDVDRIAPMVSAWAGSSSTVREVVVPPNAFCDHPSPQVSVSWRTKALASFLDDLGLDKRPEPEARRAPESIWTASEAGVAGFLSGIFSTDGSVSVRKGYKKIEISLASVSNGLMKDVQRLLFAFGVKSTLCAYEDGREEQGYRKLWKLNVSAIDAVQRFAEKIGFYNERKAAKLSEALASYGEAHRAKYPRVKSVSPCRVAEPVYDLVNVGEEHQFTANGITVSNCYATDGRYSSVAVQVAEILRFHWARESIKTPAGRKEFIDILVDCIRMADIKPSRHKRADGKAIRPFRIHSSGDFYDQAYTDVWIDIMNACPDITFWAPTRTWVVPGWIDYWKGVYKGRLHQPNFTLRLSAFHVGDKAPNLDGLPKGSAVIYEPYIEQTRGTHFDYVCEAYAVDDPKHSCDMAKAPDGEKGCRACWAKPELAVVYVAH